MRKTYVRPVLGALLMGGVACQCMAADIYVIANGNTSVGAADVREIFMGEKQFAGTVKINPIDNSACQDVFLAKVLKMDLAKYVSSWTKKSFRDGLVPPGVKSIDIEVLEYVRHTPGAVGYVSIQPSGVTVVQKY